MQPYSKEPSSSVTVGVSVSTVEKLGISRSRSSARLPTLEKRPRRWFEVAVSSQQAVRFLMCREGKKTRRGKRGCKYIRGQEQAARPIASDAESLYSLIEALKE